MSVAVLAAGARVDDAAGAAQTSEVRGLTRGGFLDSRGRPLAYTENVHGTVRREYALRSLSLVIGYRDPAGRWHGLEGRFNGLLESSRARRDWRTFFLHLTGRAIQGGDVRLTLDRSVQSAAQAVLGSAKGAIVALDPRTGAVLAMVSNPSCSPETLSSWKGYDRCRADGTAPLMDRALQGLEAPGSAFKIVTLSAALDTRRFSLSTVFRGADAFGPSPYFDNTAYPSNVTRSDLSQLTLAQALAFSDNFTFAHIGITLGARTLLRYAHRFLIGHRIPFIYPIAVSSIADSEPSPSTSVLAESSFGGAVDRVTPMQMALIAASVANGGTLMAPYLVAELRSGSGKVVWRQRPRVLSHVMSSRAAREVTDGMSFVVNHGSGYRAQISGLQVAGKTGTAASGGANPHAWFIAFAPARHPVAAVAVLHEFAGEGFKFAAPLARKVLIAALREDGYRAR